MDKCLLHRLRARGSRVQRKIFRIGGCGRRSDRRDCREPDTAEGPRGSEGMLPAGHRIPLMSVPITVKGRGAHRYGQEDASARLGFGIWGVRGGDVDWIGRYMYPAGK